MTLETLKRAKELYEAIRNLINQKDKWNNANGIYNVQLKDGMAYTPVNVDYIDFEVLRTLVLAKINKELEQLQEEFDSL
nr:MAG TPA: hypothetical protein [Crassvirales sp.]